MKKVSFVKRGLMLCICVLSFTLLPIPMLHIPDSIAIVEASEYNNGDNVTNVKLNVKTVSLVKEDSYTLRVYNTTDSLSISFRSNDKDIASVKEGKNNTASITGNSVGNATITVTIKDGKKTVSTLECEVIVGPPIKSYKFIKEKVTLNVGKRRTLSATVMPSNTTETPIFSSEDSSIAYVNPFTGLVIAKAAGTTTITATFSNGTATCTIVVNDSEKDDSEE